jgi:hypothetical protein
MNPILFPLCLGLTLVAPPAHAALVSISEVFYDASGSDDGQVFVELYGPAGHSLDGHVLEGVNGSDGSVTITLMLGGAIPGDGFFVVADTSSGSTSVPEADLLANFDFQNGPDSVVLRAPGGAPLDAVGYGVFGSGDVFAGEGASAPDAPAGQSVSRHFANRDTNDNAADFAAAVPTPGSGPLELPEPRPGLLLGSCSAGLARWVRRRRRDP